MPARQADNSKRFLICIAENLHSEDSVSNSKSITFVPAATSLNKFELSLYRDGINSGTQLTLQLDMQMKMQKKVRPF